MRVFLTSIIAILVVTVASQYAVSHYAGRSSESAYSDHSARPD